MFKYCVWYVLEPNHYLYKDIQLYSEIFNTKPFIPHITIRHSINTLDEAIHCMLKYKKLQTYYNPIFKPKLNFEIQTTEMNQEHKNIDFHSIELPLYKNTFLSEIKNPHISLVYRINGNPFKQNELHLLKYNIDFKNLSIKIVDCHSEDPSKWSFVNPRDLIIKHSND